MYPSILAKAEHASQTELDEQDSQLLISHLSIGTEIVLMDPVEDVPVIKNEEEVMPLGNCPVIVI